METGTTNAETLPSTHNDAVTTQSFMVTVNYSQSVRRGRLRVSWNRRKLLRCVAIPSCVRTLFDSICIGYSTEILYANQINEFEKVIIKQKIRRKSTNVLGILGEN